MFPSVSWSNLLFSAREDSIEKQGKLGNMLIQAGLVTQEQVEAAMASQAQSGGRIGDHLAAQGTISADQIQAFLHEAPGEPASIEETGLDATELLTQLMKLIFVERIHTINQFSDAIKLPPFMVIDIVRMAVERHLLHSTGGTGTGFGALDYALTDEGKRWAMDALQQCRYAGPAPVTIESFTRQVLRQKPTHEFVTADRLRSAFSDLVVEDSIVEQCGPAMAAAHAMLLYGPPGNGKTSVAIRLANVFQDTVYIPYAISVNGEIIRVFDSSIHQPVAIEGASGNHSSDENSFVRRAQYDSRWVPCRRPFVVTGGELTLDMLELRHDPNTNFYEAPLHVKALGGCLLIDDFGRQLVSPTHLLNRWIVPLESHVDFMRLQSGKTFQIPFEELLIFSTNLEPEDLMDPAFLRRLPYKIEVAAPTTERFCDILTMQCEQNGLDHSQDIFNQIISRITQEKGMELAAFHPRFIVEQVAATCRFLNQPLHFNPRYIDHAINNLRVRRQGNGMQNTLAHI